MKLRLIGGRYGGRAIDSPTDNMRTHPMGERIRNAMFNSIGMEVVGAHVLDAFAGTGAIGLEALSRGASHVTFIEKDRIAQRIIHNNITLLGVENNTTLIRGSVSTILDTFVTDGYDIIFADPPYKNEQFSTVSRLFGLLCPKGLMVLSHTGRSEVPTENGVVVVDNRSYGNANLTYYRRVS